MITAITCKSEFMTHLYSGLRAPEGFYHVGRNDIHRGPWDLVG